MATLQISLRDEELEALHGIAKRSGCSVADLVREAVRRVWLRTDTQGPVALWDDAPTHTSIAHDHIYDEP